MRKDFRQFKKGDRVVVTLAGDENYGKEFTVDYKSSRWVNLDGTDSGYIPDCLEFAETWNSPLMQALREKPKL
jgi:hypothetical protein